MNIIDCRSLSRSILDKVKQELALLSFQPVFCDILVGGDPSSIKYVEVKRKTAESLGIKFHNANFPESVTTEGLIKEIKILNKIPNMCGIIIQLPLPEHLERSVILDAIDPHLDVDCLGTVASKKFYKGENKLGFPAALASVAVLDSLGLNLQDKKIVVLGQGMLVGRPVTALLKFRNLNPEIITSKTENKKEIIKNSDVIISGIGKGKFIKSNMIQEGVVLIDAGTSEENNSIVGDVDFDSIKDMEGFISKTPGGVGPVTVAMLFRNVLNVAKLLSQLP